MLNKRILNQTVKRYVALGLTADEMMKPFTIPAPQLTIDSVQQQDCIARLNLPTNQPAVALFPGAEYGPAKPLSSYQLLSDQLQNQGYTVWVFGSEKDREAGEQVAVGGNVYNLCGKTSLSEAIDLIAHCQAAITNDSGLMHIAAAVHCPLVAIYGSSSPIFTPPLTEQCEIIYLDKPRAVLF